MRTPRYWLESPLRLSAMQAIIEELGPGYETEPRELPPEFYLERAAYFAALDETFTAASLVGRGLTRG